VVFDVPLVQPKRELVYVALKVLAAERVVGSVEATFQDSPDTFDAVGMGHAVHELFGAVIDHRVVELLIHATICAMFIGEENGTRGNGIVHLSLDRHSIR
jgi:hypothetical protein